MKKFVLDKCISLITKNNPHYNQNELDKIRYGLGGIYLTITKAIVLIAICYLLGILKEFLIFTILFNGMRMFAFGVHASKSYICLIVSGLIFILSPYFASIVFINPFFKLIIWLFCLSMIMLYAPADTHKRPLINAKKRMRFKILSLAMGITYGLIALFIDNSFLSNCLIFALIIEVCMILPISYKLLKVPYKNYNHYVKSPN